MTGNEGLSADIGALGWEAAYTSNEAHTAIQEARTHLDKLNEIAALGLVGVTIEESAITAATAQAEQARIDFDTLSSMAGAVALLEDSPLAMFTPARPGTANLSGGAVPEQSVERKTTPEMQERLDAIMVGLLENGGRVEAGEGRSAAQILKRITGLSGHEWANARQKLQDRGLIKGEKEKPQAKRFVALSVDRQTLSIWRAEGKLSDEVVLALDKLEERETEAAKDNASGGNGDFLAARVDEEEQELLYPENFDDELDEDLEVDEPDLDTDVEIDTMSSHFSRADGYINVFVRAGGVGYEATFDPKRFGRLGGYKKLLIAWGMVQTESYSCHDTIDKKRDFVMRLVNKAIAKDKLFGEEDVQALLDEAIANGHIHQNGRGPEITRAGVESLLPKDRNQTKERRQESDFAVEPVELGRPGDLDAIAEADPGAKPYDNGRKFPRNQYIILRALMESNGSISSNGAMTTALKALGVRLADTEKSIQKLAERGLVAYSDDQSAAMVLTPTGLATIKRLEQDEEGLVAKVKAGTKPLGETALSILDFVGVGEFTGNDGSRGWIFGRNSSANLLDRLAQESGVSYEAATRRLCALRESGYIEVSYGGHGSEGRRGGWGKFVSNARLTEEGRARLAQETNKGGLN